MSISASTITLLAPELSTQSEERINYFIAEASLYINRTIWGAKSDFAHALYTAHLMTMANLGGAGGALTSEKVGDLSRNYSVSSASNSIGSTSYGQQFLNARKSLLISPIIVR